MFATLLRQLIKKKREIYLLKTGDKDLDNYLKYIVHAARKGHHIVNLRIDPLDIQSIAIWLTLQGFTVITFKITDNPDPVYYIIYVSWNTNVETDTN